MGLGVVALLVSSSGLRAGPADKTDLPVGDVAALAARIDEHIAAGYADKKATPAEVADDAEFIRRVYLDLAGRIPRSSEVREFLADKAADKRRQLVDKLLDGRGYETHFSHVWRSLLITQTNNQQALGTQMETWVRKRVRDNTPYDELVRQLLTAEVLNNNPRRNPPPAVDPGIASFYQANEFKPENLAASTSRLFLGVKLECAQCHDHPFAKWTRQQFWEYAAFFSGFQQQEVRMGVFRPAQEAPDRHEIKIGGTDKVVGAKFLDGTEPDWKEVAPTRTRLAQWMTSPENPYFARAAANRLWAHFFGLGIIDPVDELGSDEHTASHPELLDDLTQAFVKNKFDVKFLIRAITASKAYQLSSSATDKSQDDPRLFARMSLKGLTAEQLFDSLVIATGYTPEPNRGNARAEFLAKFANASDKRTEHQTSILQALALMNGKLVADLTSTDVEKSKTFAAFLTYPYKDTQERLDALFLNTLSRPMRPDEASRLVPYVEKGGPSGDSNKALADVYWVLLNSSEFFLNH
jgi:hypothetical protein